jgi:hypothetical protein
MRALAELVIGGEKLHSRLFVGTGKFSSPQLMAQAVEASKTELVTVALRRVDVNAPIDPTLSALDFSRYRLLPNTSGARDAEEAVRVAKLSRVVCKTNWIKLEVTPDPNYLIQWKHCALRNNSSGSGSWSCPTSMPIQSWPNASPKSAAPRSCRSLHRSVPIGACKRGINCRSSSNNRRFPWSWTRASGCRHMPPKRSSLAPTLCS